MTDNTLFSPDLLSSISSSRQQVQDEYNTAEQQRLAIEEAQKAQRELQIRKDKERSRRELEKLQRQQETLEKADLKIMDDLFTRLDFIKNHYNGKFKSNAAILVHSTVDRLITNCIKSVGTYLQKPVDKTAHNS